MVIVINSLNKIYIKKNMLSYLDKNDSSMNSFIEITLNDKVYLGLYSKDSFTNENTFGENFTNEKIYGDLVIVKFDSKQRKVVEFTKNDEIIEVILKLLSNYKYLTFGTNKSNKVNEIYFGTYPQTLVTDEILIDNLNKVYELDERDYLNYNNNNYIRVRYNTDKVVKIKGNDFKVQKDINYYFSVDPIKWEVLYDGDEKILLSSLVIDYYPFNIKYHEIKIEEQVIDSNEYYFSDIRKYLNKYFYNIAFSDKEKLMIKSPINDNNFVDRVTLLSFEIIDYVKDINCEASNYCEFIGCKELDDNFNVGWWLKSKGKDTNNVRVITNHGKETLEAKCYDVRYGIRPVINIKN